MLRVHLHKFYTPQTHEFLYLSISKLPTKLCYSSSSTTNESTSVTEEIRLIEEKWQKKWQPRVDRTNPPQVQSGNPKKYILSMFPYPSGRLHMGHVRVYTIADCLARYYKLKGFSVLSPMGWDAFGLPAENAAIENNSQPSVWTYSNINQMKKQLIRLGFDFDWPCELATCSPEYYKWTQWIFLKLFQKGFAYRAEAAVNWDPIDQTVLANEQVDAQGRSWRSGAIVEKKNLNQWFFGITQFADELLQGLDELNWPSFVVAAQKSWIGKSQGLQVDFQISDENKNNDKITIFTTRPDTIFGVTFLAISVNHPLVEKYDFNKNENTKEIFEDLKKRVNTPPDIARQQSRDIRNIIGFDSGIKVIHPLTKEKIPVWLSSYVLSDYAEGAVMGVPAHDSRDFDFAKKYSIPIKTVVVSTDSTKQKKSELFEEYGTLIDSGDYSGMSSVSAFDAISKKIESLDFGKSTTKLRLKDWLVSRQRYWGCPIPIIYCNSCGTVPVPEHSLPVLLPDNIKISKKGGSPLKQATDWLHTNCPKCNGPATRESDTMDTFVDSSWYYLRFMTPKCDSHLITKEAQNWLPVDVYIGGIEHAILHLLYSRFINRFLYSEGLSPTTEPFKNLVTQGMVQSKTFKVPETGEYVKPADVEIENDIAYSKKTKKELTISWEKMSKSKHNGVDPSEIVSEYGADAARLYTLFKAPPSNPLEFERKDLSGHVRFLNRLLILAKNASQPNLVKEEQEQNIQGDRDVLRLLNETILSVATQIESSCFNVAVAELMKLTNAVFSTPISQNVRYTVALSMAKMLFPLAPHLSCEMLELLHKDKTVDLDIDKIFWPEVDEKALHKEEIEVVIQIQGKTRGSIKIASENVGNDEKLTQEAQESVIFKNYVKNSLVKKVIISPKRNLINFVLESKTVGK